MAQYAIQWDVNALSGAGQIQWIQLKPPQKYFIKQNNQYYTIKSEFYDEATSHNFTPLTLNGGATPNKIDFDTFGFDDLTTMTNNMTKGTDTFIPIDKLESNFDIVMYKE